MRKLLITASGLGEKIFSLLGDGWEKSDTFDSDNLERYHGYQIVFLIDSDIASQITLDSDKFISLHLSKLPRYRGKSPVEHQILSGETETAVSYFILNREPYGGDIVFQKNLKFGEDLELFWESVTELAILGIKTVVKEIQDGSLIRLRQEANFYSPLKSKKARHSEIKLADLISHSAKQLHDKIRVCQNSGQEAFLKLKDGSKIFFTNSRFEDSQETRKKRILVLGHRGMLGHMLVKYLSRFHKIETTELRFPSKEFQSLILRYDGDYIVNCIGSIPQKTKEFNTNYDLPKFLERAAKCRIIHPATDCEMDDDAYGQSKRKATEYIRNYGKKTKILQTSIIGPEIDHHKSLWDWFFHNDSKQISGYTDAIWNGITTLQWAKICLNMIEAWDHYKRQNVVDGERISKFHLLFTLAEELKKNVTLRPVAGKGKDKTLKGEINVPSIRIQIKELINFYY
jgi:dTDP-4-dehydrorhamnose reductase